MSVVEAPASTNAARRFSWAKVRYYLPALAVTAVLLAVGQLINPGFMGAVNLSTILAAASVLALGAIGQLLVVLVGRDGIDLSVGATMSMGAVLCASISNSPGLSVAAALPLLIAIGAAIGLVNGLIIAKLGVPPLVVTMAMAIVVGGFTLAWTQGAFAGGADEFLRVLGSAYLGPVRWIVLLLIAAAVAAEWMLRGTRFGRSIYLIGSNASAARVAGLRSNRTIVLVYAVAGISATLAGVVFLGFAGSAQLGMADGYVLLTVAAVAMGGASLSGGQGTYLGAVLGALMLVVLTQLLTSAGVAPGIRQAIQGAVLLAILVFYASVRSKGR